MRFREFLVEYSREKTASALGDKLIAALIQEKGNAEKYKNIDPNIILSNIEGRDPTPNKEYTQWMARMYANGDVKLEDLNRHDWLGLYDLAKKRRILKLEDRDINKFRTYEQFEEAFAPHYPLDELRPQKEIIGAEAKKVFEDAQVLVVIPENEAAACKYGAGTRWCTAATRGENYFNHYNSEGPLYIIIPKKPVKPGEKYQLHFKSEQYMDENDHSILLDNLFTRFPNLVEFFIQQNLVTKVEFKNIETGRIQVSVYMPYYNPDVAMLRGVALRHAVSMGRDLRYCDLRNTDFSNLSLRNINFTGCDFSGSFLESVDLTGCDLTNANFSNADMRYAELDNVLAHNANFENANVKAALIRRADFTGANVKGANFILSSLGGSKIPGMDNQWRADQNLHPEDLEENLIDYSKMLRNAR